MKGEHEMEALQHFKKTDPVLYAAAKRFKGTITDKVSPKRGADALFASLASSVVSQQLSLKAAATIWERLKAAAGGKVTAATIATVSEHDMRAAGLSAAKVKTLKELSTAVTNGLDLPALRKLPEEIATQKLTEVWGIGTWTAEMFLMFALGRPDVFSPKDLGVMRAMEELYGVPKDSHQREYIALAERWAPHRSVACLVLWKTRDT